MVDGDDVDMARLDRERDRYPFCVVWTPIPLLTWLFPFLGHTGIGLSDGVIRDFAGPYYVSEDHMAFGSPTRYLQLDPDKVEGGQVAWDRAIQYASDVYSRKMHNLFCDNCHSHVCLALNTMEYNGKTNCNMVKLALKVFFCAKYVSVWGFLKTWLPFTLIAFFITTATILRSTNVI